MPSSQLALKPVSTASLSCKICGGEASLYGVVDFHKSCNPALRTPVAGVPVYYRRCATCGFLFTDAFDDWDHNAFK
ncbi:MAG TPA: class I SAM-dependent methyltransferase, partial [Bradyrhizobium sp.]